MTATKMTCKTCGGAGDSLFFRRDSDEEQVMCRAHARKAAPAMTAAGWLSQSVTTAASPTGRAIRQHLRAAGKGI